MPKATITAANNRVSGFSESGADNLNLTVNANSQNFFETRIGTDLAYKNFAIRDLQIKPKITFSIGRNLASNKQSSVSSFAGASFENDSRTDRNSIKYGFGFDIYKQEDLTLLLAYEAEEKSKYHSDSGSVYVKYNF
jgi:hypothetical protein